jgi:hypothetical protein
MIKNRRKPVSPQFVGMYFYVFKTPQYRSLSPYAVKLLLDIYFQYTGFNNGDLSATWKLMKKEGWHSKGTLERAIKELLESGFIQKTRQGGRNQCCLYAITWKNIDECKGKLDVKSTSTPSNLWKQEIT